jgi:hypothetical protein
MKNALAIVALGFVAATVSANADAQIAFVPGLTFGTSVAIACKNPGSSQDVAKTPYLVNNTAGTLKKGQVVTWQASDGDKGSVTLAADLLPGAQLKVQGSKAGNAYTCSGFFFSKADLTVTKAMWSGSSAVAISITNKDPWVGAAPGIMHVEIRTCSGALSKSIDTAPIAIAPGETKSLTLPATMPAGKSYLRVVADNGKVVAESNESNNVWDAQNSCVY